MSPRRVPLSVGLALCLLAETTRARADDVQELAGLLNESVVSGASKTSEAASDAPATTVTITAADMRRYGIRSLDEAINFLGMGFITQNPLHSVDIGGRGVLLTADFGNHVLLVVDGHVMNEPWDGTAYFEQGAAIPIDLIDHIELILGPGAVLYGGNAMIGVIHVVTKRAASHRGVQLVAEGSASPEQGQGGAFTSFAPADLGGSYRLSLGIGHEFLLLGKPAEISAGLEYYAQSGPSFEWGPQTVTDSTGAPVDFGPRTAPGVWGGRTFHQYTTSVPAVLAHFSMGDLSVMARAATYSRTTPYVNGFNQLLSDFDEPRSFERDRWLSLDVKYALHPARGVTVTSRAYGDVYDYEQPLYLSDGSVCASPTSGACVQTARGVSQWAGLELQTEYDWTGEERLTTMIGLDGRIRHVGGETDTNDAQSGARLGAVGLRYVLEPVGAAYVQQRLSPLDGLHLNGGIRFDTDPRGGNRFSPRAAAIIDLWRGGVLKAIYSEAFRAPTFYEAYYESPQQVPSPDVHSEVVRSVESSFEQKAGAHRLLFGVYRSWWSDMISLSALGSGVYQYQNLSSIDNFGYNLLAEGTVGAFSYGASLTGAHTRRQSPAGSEPLPVAPQLFGNARISYDLPGALPVVALATQFVGARPADRALDGNFSPTPYAPPSLELRATVSDRLAAMPQLSYRIGASFVTATSTPYVAGPTQSVSPGAGVAAELAPVNRFTVFATLQYDLPL